MPPALVSVVRTLGLTGDGAASSREAFEYFRWDSGRLDLIITDMTMPKLPGDLLAQEIFKLRPGRPVILCTGHSSLAEEMGIHAMLMKPLKLSDPAVNVRRVPGDTPLMASRGVNAGPARLINKNVSLL